MEKESYEMIKKMLEIQLTSIKTVLKFSESAFFKHANEINELKNVAGQLEKALEDLKELNEESPIEEKLNDVEALAKDPETLHKLLELRKTLMDLKNTCKEQRKNDG
jgi:predicted component of type VI protein secretion system